MHSFDEITSFFAEICLIAERLCVDSVFERHEISVRHFRFPILIFLALRAYESPLFSDPFQIIFGVNCSVKYFKSSILVMFLLAENLLIDFGVYLLQLLSNSVVSWVVSLLLCLLLGLLALLLLLL